MWAPFPLAPTLRAVEDGVGAPSGFPRREREGEAHVKLRVVDPSEGLIARCQAGDLAAFTELFRLHQKHVSRLVVRLGARAADLEDLVQEVFVQVHRSLPDFRGQARFSTWLYRVTVNVVLMHRRAQRSRPVLTDMVPWGKEDSSELLPDDAVSRNRRVAALYRLLDRLSDKKRAVFVLHELEGLASAEISKIVGAPVLTVRTRLFYARRELAALMREEPALAALADELLAPEAPKPARSTRVPLKEPV
jgi:RNA polymerase sigma-70 factor (ECF subfamily)